MRSSLRIYICLILLGASLVFGCKESDQSESIEKTKLPVEFSELSAQGKKIYGQVLDHFENREIQLDQDQQKAFVLLIN